MIASKRQTSADPCKYSPPKLRTRIAVSPPLLTHLPHPSWWGTWGADGAGVALGERPGGSVAAGGTCIGDCVGTSTTL
jgi:hypothetical protein